MSDVGTESYVRNRLPLVASAIVTQRRFSSLAAQIAATATAQFRDPPKRCTVSPPVAKGRSGTHVFSKSDCDQ